MAHLHKKIKKGRTYYYARESTSVGGKTKITNQVYLGSIERIMEMARQSGEGGVVKLQVQEFGALWLACHVAEEVGLVDIIDGLLHNEKRAPSPTTGEYFLFAVLNRMVEPRSKRALPEWYNSTAVQQLRYVDTQLLDSRHYWKCWHQVDEEHVKQIATQFFKAINAVAPSGRDCLLFDTTNFFTFFDEQNPSELAKRGKSKEGRDWLKQIGLALLVARDTRLPLFYREFEGNRHDSKVFLRVIEDVLDAAGKDEATLVFDKGMNSQENVEAIDRVDHVHFITTYSPYFADDLMHVDLDRFTPVDSVKNRRLAEGGRDDDRLVAWRTTRELWGAERTAIVTYNPFTATKQRYRFERKLLELQTALFELRAAARSWRKPDIKRAQKKYHEICEALYLPKNLYDVSFEVREGRLRVGFRKNHYRISRHIDRFGKNIIVTDRHDWSTDEIVRASLDRYIVEQAFRQSKDHELVRVRPMYHWTDSKIRCHLLTCVMTLTLLRLIELRLHNAGLDMTANEAMRHMRGLHSCLCFQTKKKNPQRMLEEPTEIQAKILCAFGHEVKRGVLSRFEAK